eukprot:6561866-Prymnesium_polylepis.1
MGERAAGRHNGPCRSLIRLCSTLVIRPNPCGHPRCSLRTRNQRVRLAPSLHSLRRPPPHLPPLHSIEQSAECGHLAAALAEVRLANRCQSLLRDALDS